MSSDRSVAIPDMITSHNIHILALSETFQNPNTTQHNSETSLLLALNSMANPGNPYLHHTTLLNTHLAVVSASYTEITSKLNHTSFLPTHHLKLRPSLPSSHLALPPSSISTAHQTHLNTQLHSPHSYPISLPFSLLSQPLHMNTS